MKLSNATWRAYADYISGQRSKPEDYNQAAMKRLMEDLGDYVVDIRGLRPQFKARNGVQMISFRTAEERNYYAQAYERFCKEQAKIKERGGSEFDILVQLLKFQQAAEEIKCEYIADAMYDSVTNHNQAAVCACKFKVSIAKCVKILHDKYGVERNNISLIWGGGNTSMSAKRKEKLAQKDQLSKNKAAQDILAELGISAEDLGLDVEAAKTVVIDDSLRLGPQSAVARQEEIDRFQKGKSLYCFFTFKAGGVGLSLHHTDEATKFKCRRPKPSGYAVEEDIPLVPTRQRVLFGSTTYSAMELVQGLGRCPRLTSLSDTPQVILCYLDTIEERIAHVISMKLKCLREVVRQAESWEDVILDGKHYEVKETRQLKEGDVLKDESKDDSEEEYDEAIEIESEEGEGD